MKAIKAYQCPYIIGVLILLCQLLCFTFSQSQDHSNNSRNTNQNTIVDNIKYNNNGNNQDSTIILDDKIITSDTHRFLMDSFGFNSSATAEPTNFTTFLDDDVAEIESIPTNQSEEFPDGSNLDAPYNNTSKVVTGSTADHPSSNPNKEPTIPAESIQGEITFAIAVTSTINLELVHTSSVMNEEQLQSFLEITVGFLSVHLFKGNYMPSLVERKGIEVVLIRQTRSLIGRSLQQQNGDIAVPLYVSFQVTGIVDEDDTDVSNSILMEGNLYFDRVLERIFVEKEAEYMEALFFVDDIYFSSLNEANIVIGEATNNHNNIGSSEKKGKEVADLPPEDIPDSSVTNIFPPSESLNKGSVQEANGINGNGKIEGAVLSLGAIIGVTISALSLLVMVAVLIYYIYVTTNRRNDSIHKNKNGGNVEDSRHKMSSPHKKKPWNRRSGLNGHVDVVAEENLLRSQHPSDKISYIASNDDLESQAMYSYNQSHDSGSLYTNRSNIRLHSNHYYGSDSMSYAYSLEPEIEASVVESAITNDRGGFFKEENVSGIPVREIPQVSMTASEKMGSVDRSKIATENKDEHTTHNHFGNTQIEIAPSELKLTKSELEMLPSNLKSSDDEDNCDEKGNGGFKGRQSRKILAPAGKLRVVIDTTLEGPVVHSVNEASMLSGKIFPGDVIIAIDEVDTRAMSASAITAVMVKTANQNRTLTVRGIS